jgi:hypothetical protein
MMGSFRFRDQESTSGVMTIDSEKSKAIAHSEADVCVGALVV